MLKPPILALWGQLIWACDPNAMILDLGVWILDREIQFPIQLSSSGAAFTLVLGATDIFQYVQLSLALPDERFLF